MAINIKNQRVIELAREAARLTGDTQTGAIERALRELIATHEAGSSGRRIDLVWQTLELVDASVDDEQRARVRRVMEEMYDESGLPA